MNAYYESLNFNLFKARSFNPRFYVHAVSTRFSAICYLRFYINRKSNQKLCQESSVGNVTYLAWNNREPFVRLLLPRNQLCHNKDHSIISVCHNRHVSGPALYIHLIEECHHNLKPDGYL